MQIRRTKSISPSQAALFTTCPLRYLLATETRLHKGTPSHPAALLGTAFHKVVEDCWGRTQPSSVQLLDAIRQKVKVLVLQESGQVTDWIFNKFGLSSVITTSKLHSLAKLAFKELATCGPLSPLQKKKGWGDEQAPPNITGPEAILDSTALDIFGKADLVAASSTGYTITDYKQSLHVSESGEVPSQYLMQLALYGLVIREKFPNAMLTGILRSPADTWRQAIDDSSLNEAQSLVTEITRCIPKNKDIESKSIAVVSEHCSQCHQRNLCPSYAEVLAGGRSSDMESLSRLDASGLVLKKNSQGSLFSLRIRRSVDEREVDVVAIPDTRAFSSITIGSDIALFNLVPTAGPEQELPNRYHIIDLTTPTKSAFTASVKAVDKN